MADLAVCSPLQVASEEGGGAGGSPGLHRRQDGSKRNATPSTRRPRQPAIRALGRCGMGVGSTDNYPSPTYSTAPPQARA